MDDACIVDTCVGAPVVDLRACEVPIASCAADFNNDGTVNTIDVLAFFSAWAAGC